MWLWSANKLLMKGEGCMSNDNYYDNDNEELYNELNRSSESNGSKDAMANIRAAKRADEKRIKELEEQLAAFSKERNESIISRVLETKGVNAKAARLVLKDLDVVSEESVNNWLADNGDLIGFQPKQENQAANSADVQAMKKQDNVTHAAAAPSYSDDIEQKLLNATTEEEILSLLNGL